jgi:hypothetical protein
LYPEYFPSLGGRGKGRGDSKGYSTKTKSTGKLVEALKEAPNRGWLVVDMKRDWNTIFRPESR